MVQVELLDHRHAAPISMRSESFIGSGSEARALKPGLLFYKSTIGLILGCREKVSGDSERGAEWRGEEGHLGWIVAVTSGRKRKAA
jgi:hypothetical protein